MNAATVLGRVRARSGLSLRLLAERAGTSHSTISAYEAGHINPSLHTVQRIVRAAGFGLAIDVYPIVDNRDQKRGDELLQVLELAAQFPTRHRQDLRYPRFGPKC
jgi:transcriptional regulator with XRE-family HTH domain